MLIVETVVRVRREHAAAKAIKAIARDLRLSRKAVRKAIRSPEAAFNYQRKVQPLPQITMLSRIEVSGRLEVYFDHRPMSTPEPDEVLVKMQAAPINPSDPGVMFGAADLSTARPGTRGGLPMITADVPSPAMRVMGGRAGSALPIGNEGCGVVVSAGGNPEAQALLGKTVALFGREMYSEYRCLPAQMAMELPAQTDPADGAACFVNPLTSLAFVETMRMEGHSAIVHTAAASSLGRMSVCRVMIGGIERILSGSIIDACSTMSS